VRKVCLQDVESGTLTPQLPCPSELVDTCTENLANMSWYGIIQPCAVDWRR